MLSQTPIRILLVDDEVDACQNLLDILSDQGYEADIALDGPGALMLIHERSYDMVLLDYRMPGMSGLELYRQLLTVRPAIPGVMLSAYVDEHTVQEVLATGIREVLSKPVNVTRLLAMIEQLS